MVGKENMRVLSLTFCQDLLSDILGLTQVLVLACNSQELREREMLDGEQCGMSVICALIEDKIAIISESLEFHIHKKPLSE